MWPRALPFAVYIALMLVEWWLGDSLAPAVDPRWLYGIRSALVAVILVAAWKRYDELWNPPAAGVVAWGAAVGVGVVICVLWVLLDFPPLVVGESAGFDPTVDGHVHVGFAVTRLAGSALVVPVMEEFFWRSFVMRWLEKPSFLAVDPSSVGWRALLVSSLVFATEHHLWFAGLLAGLAYGELYRRTGNLRVAVVAHAVTNGGLGAWVLVTGSWRFW
jgi:CAAX prenyl protease-like protein